MITVDRMSHWRLELQSDVIRAGSNKENGIVGKCRDTGRGAESGGRC